MYRSNQKIREIAVLDQPGQGRCALPNPPEIALGVFDAVSTIGITVGISFVEIENWKSLHPYDDEVSFLRYYLAKDGDLLEVPRGLHYLGRTPKGVHVWTSLPRAQ